MVASCLHCVTGTGRQALREKRSAFLAQAAEKELLRLRQIKAIKTATGTWKDKDHPELKQGAAKWVNKLRREYDERFKRVTAR
jgi:hypothetical protein